MTRYNIYRSDTNEILTYFRSLADTAEYLNLTPEGLQWLMETSGRTDLMLLIDGESVECRVVKHETVEQRDPTVGATVWSFVITDYGAARDGWEDELDLPVRIAYSMKGAALKAAKEALVSWMLSMDDDFCPDEIPVRRVIRDAIHDDKNWKQQDGEDVVWSSGDGPNEVRCRVYPVTIRM